MSTWTEVTGIIRCDWFSLSRPNKNEVERDLEEHKKLLTQIFDRKHSPQGTNDSYIRGSWSDDDVNTIVLLGSLRDFGEEEIVKFIVPWWNWLIEILPDIRQAVMICTSDGHTHIFEKRMVADCDLVSENSPLWREDSGITIHTTRTIIKK